MEYLYIILTFNIVIIIHELGHYLCARIAKIQVERFSIGFGPKLVSFKAFHTSFWLSLFPLGGYVLLRVKTEEEYFSLSPVRRILFTLGGPLFNICFAYLLLVIYSCASLPLSTATILIYPLKHFVIIIIQMGQVLQLLFTHPEQLTGVVGMVAMSEKLYNSGILSVLNIAILLNINLAIMNLLPLPVLDGGKILLALFEKLIPKIRNAYTVLSLAGLIIIIGFFVFMTVSDILRLVV